MAIEVSTPAELNAVRNSLSGDYVQTANIDLSSYTNWEPIGTSSPNQFTGTLDGQGYTISNLHIDRPGSHEIGLFGRIDGATIENVVLTSVDIKGGMFTGSLIGRMEKTTVRRCSATGTMVGGAHYVGGLIGFLSSSSSLVESWANVNITGAGTHYGGLAGYCFSTIRDCYARGNVSTSGIRVGGLVGYLVVTTDRCYSTGAPSTTSTDTPKYLGGLVGHNNGTVSNSFWDTQTSGLATSGGGTGRTTAQMRTLSTFTGAGWDIATFNNFVDEVWKIDAGNDYPILPPPVPPVRISNIDELQAMRDDLAGDYVLVNDIDASATATWNSGAGFEPVGTFAAPFTGTLNGQGYTINNLHIDRSSTDYIGLFGHIVGATIENVVLTNVDIKGGRYTGSLIGRAYSVTTLRRCSVTGIIVGGTEYVGGLIGFLRDSSLVESWANVNITHNGAGVGDSYGGLVGTNAGSSTVSDCYARGNVSTSGIRVGGLAGYSSVTITRCYSTGAPSTTSTATPKYLGGLVGWNNGGTVSNSFWDTQTSGLATSDGGTGRTTAQMQDITTFSGATWDIATLNDFVNEDWKLGVYPRLGWEIITYPIEISNVDEFQAMRNGLAFDYVIVNDIDASATSTWNSGAGFEPVGTFAAPFTGTLDGQGYTISNLHIDRSSSDDVGLFGSTDGATIENVVLTSVDVKGGAYTGSLCGRADDSTIYRCGSNGRIIGGDFVGGLIGNISSTSVQESFSSTQIGYNTQTDLNYGGLIGYSAINSSIIDCYASGVVSNEGGRIGGLVGWNLSGSIINRCYSTAAVVSDSTTDIGGLVGLNNGTINNSFWDVKISRNTTSSGGTGKTTTQMRDISTFTGVSWDIISSEDHSDEVWKLMQSYYPLLGWETVIGIGTPAELQAISDGAADTFALMNDLDLSSISNFNPIGKDPLAGWFKGRFLGGGHTIFNLNINRSGQSQIGLFGRTGRGSIIDSVNIRNASVVGFSDVGILVGSPITSIILRCSTSGIVNGHGNNVGGISGWSTGSSFLECYSNTTLTAVVGSRNNYGGLIGNCADLVPSGDWITDCYATGSVTATGNRAGGLIGVINNSTVNRCYSIGAVSVPTGGGGLIGVNNGGTVSNSFWDIETSGWTTISAGGTARTTAQMKDISTFTGAGWDIVTIPSYDDETWKTISNSTYPLLGWQEIVAEISNINELQAVADIPGLNYVISNDIDASVTSTWNNGFGFQPIGRPDNPFTGHIDGQNHTIDGLYINRPSQNYAGLVGLANNCSIENIIVTNVNFTGFTFVSGLCGQAFESTIHNCHSTGTAHSTSNTTLGVAGGIVGAAVETTITDSHSECNVSSTSRRVGGFVGQCLNSSISRCYATGNASSTDTSDTSRVGGFAGRNTSGGTIVDCYARGNATSGGDIVGGFVGTNDVGSLVNRCYSTGAPSGAGNVRGLIGLNSSSTVSNSFWDTQTSGRTTSQGGTGRTTAQMQILATFTNAGWDIATLFRYDDEDWKLPRSDYPILGWQEFFQFAPVEVNLLIKKTKIYATGYY